MEICRCPMCESKDEIATHYLICPNQFDDSDAGEICAFHDGVSDWLNDEDEATELATKLAGICGHSVQLGYYIEHANGDKFQLDTVKVGAA